MNQAILFTTEMVQAILAGRKTQTRRLIKPQPLRMNDEIPMPIELDVFSQRIKKLAKTGRTNLFTKGPLTGMIGPKPKYEVGDILWVRETFCRVMLEHAHDLLEGARDRSLIAYKANFHPDWMEYAKEKYGYKWKPSRFMPRSACRLFLKVTEVRAERLQDISAEDAIAEGIESHIPVPGDGLPIYGNYNLKGNDAPYFYNAKDSFSTLWDSINGKKCPWDSNPYVWVITFKTIIL
jgi:hypothetical protein